MSTCALKLQRRCDLHLPTDSRNQLDEVRCIQFPLVLPIFFPELALALGLQTADAYRTQRESVLALFVRQRVPSEIVGVGTVAVAHSEAELAFPQQVYWHSLFYMRFAYVKCHVDKVMTKFDDELWEQRC